MDMLIEILIDVFFDVGVTASTSSKLPKPIRFIFLAITVIAMILAIAVLAAVAINTVSEAPVISILLGFADAIICCFAVCLVVNEKVQKVIDKHRDLVYNN